jgi:hypothetical protein
LYYPRTLELVAEIQGIALGVNLARVLFYRMRIIVRRRRQNLKHEAGRDMDWSQSDEKIIQEIIREAEAYLQAQLSLAIAADQRSSVMASVFAAGAAAVMAGLMTLAASDHAQAYVAIYVGGIVASALMLAGAALCIRAAQPTDFAVPGNMPACWYDDIGKAKDFKLLLGEQAEIYQSQIAENNATLTANARYFAWGARLSIGAPLVGFFLWLIFVYLSRTH